MSTAKSPVERALELLVFAPVGLAVSARDLLPRFVERGRQQVTGQVGMAKLIGQFAVQQGQTEAEKALDRARASARSTLEQLRTGEGPEREAPLATASSTTATPATPVTSVVPAEPGPVPTSAPLTPAAGRPEPRTVRPRPDVVAPQPAAATRAAPRANPSTLAIPAYDSLSASQVVPRLSSLTKAELASVGAYEAGHRGRKTILNKVAQLQGR